MKRLFALAFALTVVFALAGCTHYGVYHSDTLKALEKELRRDYDCVEKMRYMEPTNGGSDLELRVYIEADASYADIAAIYARVGEVLSDSAFLLEFLEEAGFSYGPEPPEEPVYLVNPGPSIDVFFQHGDRSFIHVDYASTRWDTSGGSRYVYEGYPQWPER